MIPAVQHDQPHNLKILTEKRNDEKLPIALLMVGGRGGGGVHYLSFLVENKWRHYYLQQVVPW